MIMAQRTITEQEFLAGHYKTCPFRLHVKDLKWSFKDKEMRRLLVGKKECDGEPLHYCKATPGGPHTNMYICNRVYNTESCAALQVIRRKEPVEAQIKAR